MVGIRALVVIKLAKRNNVCQIQGEGERHGNDGLHPREFCCDFVLTWNYWFVVVGTYSRPYKWVGNFSQSIRWRCSEWLKTLMSHTTWSVLWLSPQDFLQFYKKSANGLLKIQLDRSRTPWIIYKHSTWEHSEALWRKLHFGLLCPTGKASKVEVGIM